MEQTYDTGDKIEYRLLDQKGKDHWFKGVIHGVRHYEDSATNTVVRTTYLIDTGRHERLDEVVFNHRDRELNQRINAEVAKGKSYDKALADVVKQTDLPESKLDTEVIRQPEQIELAPGFIRPLK